MAFTSLRGASSGLLAVLRKGPRLRKRSRKPKVRANAPALPGGEASPTCAPIASLAPLTHIISQYLDNKDIERVKEAYRFSDQAHLGQFRASGEPYISHPIAVTEICAGWKLDADSLMAALLHDVMEDTAVPKQELAERFGPDVAEIVDGLSKLDRLEFATKAEQQAESFRKMLLAMARDVRVILIKLADRLHNM
ncbi:MAG TPA: guanosine-3',5'-bis(diphosphate) 3'-pyrophosphohydrolase, partial [Pusillimonas sp.]|nr:guanosine-3',5'-bis(diphosphate) 3'-pyrophosphohydrolase [Pusillimonas sp.]